MREQKTEAIILATTDVFDADRSYLLFTREFGKVRARAKGVRRPTSRLTGHLLSFLPTELELVAHGSFFLIVKAHMPTGSAYPEDSLSYLRYAEQLAEGIDKLTVDQEPHPAIYDALEYTLELLREKYNPKLAVAEFFMKCLANLGYHPQLEKSVLDDLPLDPEHLAWNSEVGGVFTVPPAGILPGSLRVQSPQSIVVLRQMMKPEFVSSRLVMADAVQQEVMTIVYDYIQTVIGKPIRSLS